MPGLSHDHQIQNLRPYIVGMMEREGRDFTRCEIGGEAIAAGQWEIHHTKYEGANYYDLRIVCRSCNRKEENCLLA